MKKTIIMLSVLLFVVIAATAQAVTCYVDISVGSSGNGSKSSPWKNVSNINGLQPGDTVLFRRDQQWSETLKPVSGRSGEPVTYGAYGSGAKPNLDRFDANGKSYITVKDISFFSNASTHIVYIYGNSHHITIDSCDVIAGSTSTAYTALRIRESEYNKVLNSIIKHTSEASSVTFDALSLVVNANYNVIEGNTIGPSSHYSVYIEGGMSSYPNAVTSYNVIRNNMINDQHASVFNLTLNANNNIIEGNIISGGSSFLETQVKSFKVATSNNIIRNNIIRDNPVNDNSGCGGLVLSTYQYSDLPPMISSENRIYNNVVTNIARNPVQLLYSEGSGATSGFGVYDNYFKNNIIYENPANISLYVHNHITVKDNYFINNILYKSGTTDIVSNKGVIQSVASANSSDPTHFKNNLQQEPGLDNNFKPTSFSPAINAGDFLTITSNSGSGIQIPVIDAGYFTDGFGIIEGDLIQLEGQTQTARITKIDYNSNVLTLDRSLTWTNGQGVSLPYSGAKPDIGAYEYGGTTQGATYSVGLQANGNVLSAEPNPFNPSTRITYQLAHGAHLPDAALQVYDLNGRKIAALPVGREKGSIIWNAMGVPAGIYCMKLCAKDKVLCVRMLFLVK